MKEHEQGIKKEKSALDNFVEKYTTDGESGVTPIQFYKNKSTPLKHFFTSHRNIKVSLVLVCQMEKQFFEKVKPFFVQERAYFHSQTHISLEATDVKELLSRVIYEILYKFGTYQKKKKNGSGW